MDGQQVFVALVRDDDDYDAQVFQSRQDAQQYCVELTLDYIRQNEDVEEYFIDYYGISGAATFALTDDVRKQYDLAHTFLLDADVQDLEFEIVERHIHRKVRE